MNQLTRPLRAANGAVAVQSYFAPPALPPRLMKYLDSAAEHAAVRARWAAASPDERECMFVGPLPQLPVLTDAERDECVEAQHHLDSLMSPLAIEILANWLVPLNAAVRNPQGQEEFRTRVVALSELLADQPRGAFTAEARRRLSGDWFPSAAEIRAAIAPDVAALRARATAIRAALAKAPQPPPAPERSTRTPSEIEAVHAMVGAYVAEVRGKDRPEMRNVKAQPLSDGALLAQYEQMAAAGNPAAQTRCEALRRALGMTQ
jgi:hypothetical protein